MPEIVLENDFHLCYPIFEKSFPPDEIRPYNEQLALLSDRAYRLYARYNGNTVESLLAVYSFPELLFIEHFATDPLLRGRGIGSALLREFLDTADRPVCLEVEPPVDDITCRRVAFYERLGFVLNRFDYLQPSISKGRSPVPLYIMTYKTAVSQKEYEAIRDRLYSDVYHV